MIEVSPEAAGNRLDHFLAARFPSLTRSRIQRLIEEGNLLSGAQVETKCGYRLRGGERLELLVPEAEPIEAAPEKLPLKILYEDSDIIVIDKAAGMVVHPAAGHSRGTLVNALLFHCSDLSGLGGKLRPGIVHRLDKDTSGVMIVTKNDLAHVELSKQFKSHSIKRRYQAVVYGSMPPEGMIDLPLGRHPKDRKKIGIVPGGRRAVTHWKLLRSYKGISFVELELETGRTHQIRVHLSHGGHPVVGDPVYGNPKRAGEAASPVLRQQLRIFGRQALHACFLGFLHPVSGRAMEFSSPLPEDMQGLLAALEKEPA